MYLAVDLLTNRPFLDILSFSCHISLRSELLFNNLTKRLFINSYTSRNQLYTILPPHKTTLHQFLHLTKSFVYHSTISPNDFASIRTPHEIICIPFYHLTKRLCINSYTSRNHLYTILPPHQTTLHQLVRLTKSTVYHSTIYHLTKRFSSISTSQNPTTLSRHHEESTSEYHCN